MISQDKSRRFRLQPDAEDKQADRQPRAGDAAEDRPPHLDGLPQSDPAAAPDQPFVHVAKRRKAQHDPDMPDPERPLPDAPAVYGASDGAGSAGRPATPDQKGAPGHPTARQLRVAMRTAKKNGLRPNSPQDAVALLQARGIDPFARNSALDIIPPAAPEPSGRAIGSRAEHVPATTEDPEKSPRARMARLAAQRDAEVQRMQRDIARRRRKRLALLGARLLIFVTLPTLIATWYFFAIATPMYATESQFVIQQADGGAGRGDLGGMLPSALGMGGSNQTEASSVQAFLQSRAAMRRLAQEEGFVEHFSQDSIDPLHRLSADSSAEAAFRLFQRQVRIGFDPTEGVVRMEVIAATPEDSERFARALIRYAEEHVDMMTQRLRDSQMTDARQSLEDAQARLIEARLAAVELQEQSAVLSGDVEVSLIAQQIGALESELSQTRLTLEDLRSLARPHPARLEPLVRREAALQDQIDTLRGAMTRGSGTGGSLARIQSQLIMAEAEIQTREMMRAQAMQQLESARIEVNRQVRYLALSVEPIAPDEPTYPRKFEYSALAFLIFLGIYLFISMTASVLREQISG